MLAMCCIISIIILLIATVLILILIVRVIDRNLYSGWFRKIRDIIIV